MAQIHGLGYVIGLLALILIVAYIVLYGWRRGRPAEPAASG